MPSISVYANNIIDVEISDCITGDLYVELIGEKFNVVVWMSKEAFEKLKNLKVENQVTL